MESHNSAQPVPARRGFAGLLMAPSWGLGLLLFICLFLPAYRGCNGQPVYVYKSLEVESATLPEIYTAFLLVWPFVFGLLVALGCLQLLWTGDPRQARWLWGSYATLVLVHSGLLIALMLLADEGEFDWHDRDEVLLVLSWLAVSILLALLVPISGLRSRNWFNAAMWMQLALGVAAAFCVSFVVPSLLLANRLLVGGQLMVFSSVFLVVSTTLQRLDGYRALTRDSAESPLRLSLRSFIFVTGLSGLASAWVGRILLQFN